MKWARTCIMHSLIWFFFSTIFSTWNKAFQSNPIQNKRSRPFTCPVKTGRLFWTKGFLWSILVRILKEILRYLWKVYLTDTFCIFFHFLTSAPEQAAIQKFLLLSKRPGRLNSHLQFLEDSLKCLQVFYLKQSISFPARFW